ncbi:MAG: glucan phosphoethanolaminetransferase (alkaline phosphatase superfamily) [Salibacteraceae bacterium]|jgi:glucan phosphoethanolaminetransferase (alkaline phosphatase superfamily)
MRKINIVTGIFCLCALSTKMIYCLAHRQTIDQVDNVVEFADYKMIFAALWLIAFGILLLVWIWAQLKKAEKTQKWLAVLTIVFALGMNITDNMNTTFYLSDIVVNGEPLE